MGLPEIFLSYPSSQKSIINQLAQAIQCVGLNPIIDFAHFGTGNNLSAEIIKAIDRSTCIVALLTKDLLSPDLQEGAWVRGELSVARQLGKPVIPVLYGLEDPSDVKSILDPLASEPLESLALTEVRNRLQSLCISFPQDGPTYVDIGTLARKVVATYRQPADACFAEDAPPMYQRLLPGIPHARLRLLSTGIAEARDQSAFGQTIVLVPTDPHGTPGGVQQRELLGTDRLPLDTVTPKAPRYLGSTGKLDSISYVQVTSFSGTISSTDQRNCIEYALKLSKDCNATLVMTALPGTGPHYGYPTFSAARSLLVGALSFYWNRNNRFDPTVPWLALVLDPTSEKDIHVRAWLRRLPTDQTKVRGLLEEDQISLAFENGQYNWVGRGSTLNQVVRQLLGREMLSGENICIQVGKQKGKLVTRRSNGGDQPFRYSSTTKLRDTIIEHGDRLLLFGSDSEPK